MPLFPVVLSLYASFVSAVSVLGIPAEIYFNGTMYWLYVFAYVLAYPVAVHLFLPVFHKLEITSINEVRECYFGYNVHGNLNEKERVDGYCHCVYDQE